MRIYLIGMPGSGKSTLGSQLAKELNYDFMDLDQAIESKASLTISEIFDKHGEAAFRQLEREVLHSTEHLEDAVISCGGGTPCFFDNMNWINDHGTSVYLKVPVEELKRRLKNDDQRPLLADHKLEDLYQERKSCYERSAHSVHNYSELIVLFE